ncbi:hypothetical protein [Borrelia sp. RT1S]|uniref:hypothetical protein n=1 Tax=Borrelia sp. RT1S TaxID=2898580 RepID=UPI001E2DAE08|nr:hypothetical protein [Borrelia sp. RT1S]UGQ18005.1 hypothetical protein LSO05_06110 [Borrelia sp. RT1S]
MERVSIIMFLLFVTLTTVLAHTQTVVVAQGRTTKAAMKTSEELEIEGEARERAYDKLEKKLRELREELIEEKNEMKGSFTTLESKIKELPKNMQLGKGDSEAERLDKICAGLGYDADSIGRVEEILEKLAVSGSDKDVAYRLLNLLYGIGNFTHQVVNGNLGETSLSKLKGNKNIVDISDMFNEFVILREEVIERVDDQIEVAVAQKNSKQRMLAELSKITRSNAEVYKKVYGKPNSLFEMQKEFERLIK